MTVQIVGTEIAQIVETAVWIGIIVTMLLVGLLVYLMVRPPRHVREGRKVETKTEMDPIEAEELWRLVDRMESRLEVLERALADESGRRAIGAAEREMILTPAGDDRDSGRKE